MTLTVGTRLDSFEIAGQLGVGGMGEVYRATDTKLGREVAIKVLPAAFADDAERLARFEREAKLLASLNHAHIASVYDLDESGGVSYIVMELVEGQTLEEKLKAGSLTVDDALQIGLQTALALEAAHERGIVHRDLKPANVMIAADGVVKVLDFGLARAFSGDTNDPSPAHSPTLSLAMTQAGLVLGTAGYMSPEQASGQPADRRADIWAFGVVLYEMLTGMPVFSGDSVPSILADVLKTEPDWTRLPKHLNPRVEQLLRRCLTKKPRNRLHSISDARIEIEAALADPEGRTVLRDASPGSATPLRLVVVGLAAAVAGAAAVWALTPGPQPGPVARLSFALPGGQSFTRPEGSMIAISPDGTQIAYVADSEIFVRELSDTRSRAVVAGEEGGLGVTSPVFSPDGEWLAYLEMRDTNGGTVRRVPVSGGTPVTVSTAASSFVPLSWPTPDAIVFRNGAGIVRAPIDGGAPELLVARRGDENIGQHQVLPGGDAVLFARTDRAAGVGAFSGDVQVVVQTIGTEDRTLLVDGGGAPTYLSSGHLVFAEGNTLFGIAFDRESRAVSGGRTPIVENLRRSLSGFTDSANYSVSETGTLVFVPEEDQAQPRFELTLVDSSGSATRLDFPPDNYRSPRFSPDGSRLAVEIQDDSGNGHVWIYDLSSGSLPQQLTQTGNNTRPIWTPDGERVTFGSEREGSWGIFERVADGSALAERLTTAAEGRRHFPDDWSPDGRTLAFTDADLGTTDWDLWTFERETGATSLFAGGDVNQFSGAFSPNGAWLAYATTSDVGVDARPYPPRGADAVQRIAANAVAPLWPATGNRMFFRSISVAGPTLIESIEIVAEGGIVLRGRRAAPIEGAQTFGGYRDFDSIDGEHFVMISAAETNGSDADRRPEVNVVLNWTSELATRVRIP